MNIVIIGGTRGIGKEIAILMSDSADNKVVVAGRNRNSLNELAEYYNSLNHNKKNH